MNNLNSQFPMPDVPTKRYNDATLQRCNDSTFQRLVTLDIIFVLGHRTLGISRFRAALAALVLLSTLIHQPSASALTPIQYNASDFTGNTNNLPVTLTSVQRIRVNNQTMFAGLPIYFTPTNGSYATNVYAGLYNLTIQGVPDGVTCLIPDSTNVQNLASCVISNMGLFSATNLTFLITNPVTLLPGTNIQMVTNGFNVTVNGVVTNLNGLIISNGVVYAAFAGDGSRITGLTSNQIPGLNASNITSGTFGQVTDTYNPRIIQLALRLKF